MHPREAEQTVAQANVQSGGLMLGAADLWPKRRRRKHRRKRCRPKRRRRGARLDVSAQLTACQPAGSQDRDHESGVAQQVVQILSVVQREVADTATALRSELEQMLLESASQQRENAQDQQQGALAHDQYDQQQATEKEEGLQALPSDLSAELLDKLQQVWWWRAMEESEVWQRGGGKWRMSKAMPSDGDSLDGALVRYGVHPDLVDELVVAVQEAMMECYVEQGHMEATEALQAIEALQATEGTETATAAESDGSSCSSCGLGCQGCSSCLCPETLAAMEALNAAEAEEHMVGTHAANEKEMEALHSTDDEFLLPGSQQARCGECGEISTFLRPVEDVEICPCWNCSARFEVEPRASDYDAGDFSDLFSLEDCVFDLGR